MLVQPAPGHVLGAGVAQDGSQWFGCSSYSVGTRARPSGGGRSHGGVWEQKTFPGLSGMMMASFSCWFIIRLCSCIMLITMGSGTVSTEHLRSYIEALAKSFM